jgi:dCMP deaminase
MTVYALAISKEGKLATATNGNFTEDGCTNEVGNCGCVHAEINLLKKLPNPYHITVSHSPCLNCAKALVEAGIEKVTYYVGYRIKDGIAYLEENGVEVKQL